MDMNMAMVYLVGAFVDLHSTLVVLAVLQGFFPSPFLFKFALVLNVFDNATLNFSFEA